MSDKAIWNYYAEEHPYYAVHSQEKFRNENLNDAVLQEFFKSGDTYLEKIWAEIEDLNGGTFVPRRSLDFGCGVGRLTIPIASKSKEVVGVDISPKMLETARENAQRRNVSNIKFVESDDSLSLVGDENFDLIHSFVVIQHILPELGEKLLLHMLRKLNNGGIGVIHVTYETGSSRLFEIYKRYPFIYRLRRLVKGEDKALIPMHEYNLNHIFTMLQENNCHNCHLKFTDHGSKGAILFFKKAADVFE